jgi:hypothetical protein
MCQSNVGINLSLKITTATERGREGRGKEVENKGNKYINKGRKRKEGRKNVRKSHSSPTCESILKFKENKNRIV